MLQEFGLAMAFWGDALAALVHVWNHCPTAALDSATPYELWHGRKPNVSENTCESGDPLPMCMYRKTSELGCTLTMISVPL